MAGSLCRVDAHLRQRFAVARDAQQTAGAIMQYIQPLWPASPEIFLLAMACIILIAVLFVRAEQRSSTCMPTQLALAGFAVIRWLSAEYLTTTLGEPVHTVSGMFVGDLMSNVLKLIACFGVMAILVYSRDYISVRGM